VIGEGGEAVAREKWRRLNAQEQQELWCRWESGQPVSEIARALSRWPNAVQSFLQAHGGSRPALRVRGQRHLTLQQREEISRGLSAQLSMGEIARRLGRSTSTISREIKRNGTRCSYRALQADEQAWERARRPKQCLLQRHLKLCGYVSRGLRQRWSPEQIAYRVERDYPHDQSMRVSHETIYRTLFVQSRGALRKELTSYLRSKHKLRHSRHASNKDQGRGQIAGAISISERPAEAADRAVPGHWEGDLLSGKANTHIATLVERHSRFLMLVKVPSKETVPVVNAVARKIKTLPRALRRSLTWDRGKEMSNHEQFTIATDVQVYFCDPHSPWQRGSNENTNGLLRQYFPKGTDLSVYSQAHLDRVARELNGRPRETLQFETPAERLAQSVAMTG
jgi:IS30 family transposase